MVEKRAHIGGNVYTERVDGIDVHRYGAHIFHTNNDALWAFVNRFVYMNRYTNSPVANYKGELYNLPFNMNTFYRLWGVKTPQEAMKRIEAQRKAAHIARPTNLEEQADVYKRQIWKSFWLMMARRTAAATCAIPTRGRMRAFVSFIRPMAGCQPRAMRGLPSRRESSWPLDVYKRQLFIRRGSIISIRSWIVSN